MVTRCKNYQNLRQYGNNSMSQAKIYEPGGGGGPKNIVDDVRSGRPSTLTHVKINEKIDQRIRDNRRVSRGKITPEMSIRYSAT
jgi:hypothetical protein